MPFFRTQLGLSWEQTINFDATNQRTGTVNATVSAWTRQWRSDIHYIWVSVTLRTFEEYNLSSIETWWKICRVILTFFLLESIWKKYSISLQERQHHYKQKNSSLMPEKLRRSKGNLLIKLLITQNVSRHVVKKEGVCWVDISFYKDIIPFELIWGEKRRGGERWS